MRNQRPRTSPFRTISRLLMILIVLLTAMPLSADSHRDPPGRLKDWSFGYSYVHLTTTAGNVYGIHSPAFNFHARNGWRTPLITSISVLVPVGIRYNDEFFSGLFDYYTRTLGMDVALGMEFGGPIGGDWRWRAAPGWNLIALSMPGRTGYYPFQSLTTGPAVSAVVERDWEQGMNIRFGLAASWQVIDLIHTADRLKSGFSLQVNAGIGFRDGAAFGRIDYE